VATTHEKRSCAAADRAEQQREQTERARGHPTAPTTTNSRPSDSCVPSLLLLLLLVCWYVLFVSLFSMTFCLNKEYGYSFVTLHTDFVPRGETYTKQEAAAILTYEAMCTLTCDKGIDTPGLIKVHTTTQHTTTSDRRDRSRTRGTHSAFVVCRSHGVQATVSRQEEPMRILGQRLANTIKLTRSYVPTQTRAEEGRHEACVRACVRACVPVLPDR
jgi:hypothetical protein